MNEHRCLPQCLVLFGVVCCTLGGNGGAAASPADRVGEKLQDVELRDLAGKPVKLLSMADAKVLVIAYTGLGCPISGRYAPRLVSLAKKFEKKGVRFVGINANPQDSLKDIAEELGELGITFAVLQDHEQTLTRQLDAKTTTVAFVVDQDRIIRYRGMIDDQYTVGGQRAKPRNKYLERAIRSVLAGKEPETTRTAAPGCLISRVSHVDARKGITYSSHVATIVQERCQSCHRPQQIAPFALTSYESVRGWSAMIYSVLEQDRMPPWNAHADFDGVFVNERIFPDDEKTILMNWIRDGMSRGNPAEDPPKKSWSGLWRIGKPTKVFTVDQAVCVYEFLIRFPIAPPHCGAGGIGSSGFVNQ